MYRSIVSSLPSVNSSKPFSLQCFYAHQQFCLPTSFADIVMQPAQPVASSALIVVHNRRSPEAHRH